MAATYKNVIDDATSVSASTTGAKVDARYHTTIGRAASGVPVRFWVYASCTTAGDDGTVRLVDSSAATVLEVAIDDDAEGWYFVDGFIPATSAKYDVHFGGNTTGVTTVLGFQLMEYCAL
jgi:hypothetical protein